MVDPTSRDAALARITEAGKRSGLWGSPVSVNPYFGQPAMPEEARAWSAGHADGAAERKAGKRA